jgi:hypothetical protein
MRALAAILASGVAAVIACGPHPHPHPEGPPSAGGSATPVEPPPDAPIEPAVPDDPKVLPTGRTTTPAPGMAPTAPAAPADPLGIGDAIVPAGCGGGGGVRPSSNVPTVKMSQPVVKGGLDAPIVRRYLRRRMSQYDYCYEKELLAHPTLKGTLDVRFTIVANGTVSEATAHGVSAEVEACVIERVKTIEFPKPKHGDAADVTVSLAFAPS